MTENMEPYNKNDVKREHHYNEPDTETVAKAVRKEHKKQWAFITLVIGLFGGFGAGWAAVGHAVDMSRTPERINQLEQAIADEKSAREQRENDIERRLDVKFATLTAKQDDMKDSIEEIKDALHIARSPKSRDQSSQ